ncbi:MAG: hydantoinase B/oxoprolinase family protein [Candidatus Obscuribacterales bacterium]|nr:hydantoinase B/oxoprolinase family protein [Candidatus Obscuribacterales bacterium]
MSGGWQFFVDRGGTFTDVVAVAPDGAVHVRKLLSDNPDHYRDATVAAVQQLSGQDKVSMVKVGTTIATNALLERKGEKTVFVTTKGFADALRIGYQNRPNIFARHIVMPDVLYSRVIEVSERVGADGEILVSLNPDIAFQDLQQAYADGFRSCAIVLMHGYRYPAHEDKLKQLAKQIGFTNISVSNEVSPLIKFVSRGDTTVADAYLSPVLGRYVDELTKDLPECKLVFMQSNGGLVEGKSFRGKDSLLSGPAGGIVGAVKTSQKAGFDKIIAFDMGGTSTDVSHFDGSLERTQETEIAGTRIRVPMLAIHTVAAGGGSILSFDGQRYRVGPQSAGANPGPACYRKGGPLTVTDCNVLLGKIQPDHFPHIFGTGNEPLDKAVVQTKFAELGIDSPLEQIAEGFLTIAVQKMSNAIKKISIERGHDVSEYALCCFGGAGGQHACLIAQSLGIKTVFIHNYAGVLSAYGIGLADMSVIRQQTVELPLSKENLQTVENYFARLINEARGGLETQAIPVESIDVKRTVQMRYQGSDSTIEIDFAVQEEMAKSFTEKHQRLFGFALLGKQLIVESIAVDATGKMKQPATKSESTITPAQQISTTKFFSGNAWHSAPVYERNRLQAKQSIIGPAIIVEDTGTNIVEPGWQATTNPEGHLVLTAIANQQQQMAIDDSSKKVDPIKLELFNNLFMSIAENMGVTLQSTSHSVNIKERLDFSCAIFDSEGNLIANAPHIPVHLGSMGDSIRSVIETNKDSIKPRNIYALNNPYNGGTHLPDITVVTPVFTTSANKPVFFVASRAHHADIGGITPGSMPPSSKTIEEEGVLIDNFLLVSDGTFHEHEFRSLLTKGKYPARNPAQNIADIQAQIAANEKGLRELEQLIARYGQQTVIDYMHYVQENAEESVRRAISNLKDGSFTTSLDDGSQITVKLSIDQKNRSAKIDFTGTSAQQATNFNAPAAITKAAVLYVFRTLVNDDIPLNEGCLKPLTLVIPECSLLSPKYPAAIVAGNVETSQAIVDCLYAAMGVLAASQGTMNNFTFGNDNYQYYETICGGSGAGPSFNGTDAVQTHMTNSRLTDPEVLENRYPVVLESFAIRQNSGGKGKFHGGNGVIRRLRFKEKMTASILSNRRRIAPFGIHGGQEALPGKNYIERSRGCKDDFAATASSTVEPGDVFTIETPGGGGWG